MDEPRPGVVRIYSGSWGPDERRRPGLPWIGVFLVVLGGLLFVQTMVPGAWTLANTLVLAAGLASLVAWAIRGRIVALYLGAFLTALALPPEIASLGVPVGPGWGTLCFGLAFLGIAAVRAARGGGRGWQLSAGLLLILIGGAAIALPSTDGLILPAVLVALGLGLVLRGARRGA